MVKLTGTCQSPEALAAAKVIDVTIFALAALGTYTAGLWPKAGLWPFQQKTPEGTVLNPFNHTYTGGAMCPAPEKALEMSQWPVNDTELLCNEGVHEADESSFWWNLCWNLLKLALTRAVQTARFSGVPSPEQNAQSRFLNWRTLLQIIFCVYCASMTAEGSILLWSWPAVFVLMVALMYQVYFAIYFICDTEEYCKLSPNATTETREVLKTNMQKHVLYHEQSQLLGLSRSCACAVRTFM
jgi:hypothetical protein